VVLLVTGVGSGSQVDVVDVLQQLGARIAPCKRSQTQGSGTASITDAVLEALGGSWAGVPNREDNADAQRILAQGELGQRALALIEHAKPGKDLVIVDERNGFVLPFWRAAISDVAVVQCIDAPAQVVARIKAHDLLPEQAAYAVWEHQIRTVLRDARDLEQAWIRRAAIHNPSSTQTLATLLGVDATEVVVESCVAISSPEQPAAATEDLPAGASVLWEFVKKGDGIHPDPDRVPPTRLDSGLLETALFAARRLTIASADSHTTTQLTRLRSELVDIKQQLRDELQEDLGREQLQQVVDDEIKALRARNHQLENARTLRIARLLGDPVRRTWRRFA